jgi:hypothetical protein
MEYLLIVSVLYYFLCTKNLSISVYLFYLRIEYLVTMPDGLGDYLRAEISWRFPQNICSMFCIQSLCMHPYYAHISGIKNIKLTFTYVFCLILDPTFWARAVT